MKRALAALFLASVAATARAAPPVITCPPAQSTYENGAIDFTVIASDPDGDPVTLSLVNKPSRAEFDPADGYFHWVPSYTQAGSYSLEFRATAGGQTVNCLVPVTIENFNLLPVIKCPAPVTASVGDTVKAQLTATDPDAGDVLTFSSANLPAGATLTPQGKFTWPTAGAIAGTRTVSFSVDDGTTTRSCSLSITLFPLGGDLSPKIFCPGPLTATEGLPIDVVVGVEATGGYPVTLILQNPPPGSTFQGGRFRWTPTLNQSGVYALHFTATNNQSPPASCTWNLTVQDVLVPPPFFTVCPGQITAPEATQIFFSVLAVDQLGQPITYYVQNAPAGSSFNAFNHTFTWVPSYQQAGTYDVTFIAATAGNMGQCVVRIVVEDRVGPAPAIFCPQAQQVFEGALLSFAIGATDPANQPLTFGMVSPPPGASITPDGLFSWRPTSTQSGFYVLQFTVSNGSTSSQCNVAVTVLDRPYFGPAIACPGDVTTYEQHETAFTIKAIDQDGDPSTFSARNLPAGAQFSAAGTFIWIPASTQAGIYQPEFIVTDGESRDSCRVRIEVLNHDALFAPFETRIARIKDIRPDQGGWVRALLVAAPEDRAGGNVTGYDLWRRIDGPKQHAVLGTPPERAGTLAEAGTEIDAATAHLLGFPDGAWEAVAHAPALQAVNVLIAAPTRRDSTAAGRPYETYVVTTQTTTPSIWSVSAAESAYSVDDLPPAAPTPLEARREGASVRLSWQDVADLDLDAYVVVRAMDEGFENGTVLGETTSSSFVDPAAPDGAWYRVAARDVHGNTASSQAVPGGQGALPATLELSAPRPNPSRAGIAFEALVPRAGQVRLAIVDARGRIVRVLERGTVPAGRHAYAWDRADAAGRTMPAGVYVVRLETPEGVRTRKVTLTR